MQVVLSRGTVRAPVKTTLAEASHAWLEAARAGLIRTRSGTPYKGSAVRSYEGALKTKVLPRIGHMRLSSISRNTVQDLVDELVAEGLAPSSVRNAILPVRAVFRRAVARDEVSINPTLRLELPADRRRRERVARPAEATALLAALAPNDRAVWATAIYAGLRRGELRGLRWQDVDFEGRLIRVEQAWDRVDGPILPKSRSGVRTVPLPDVLRIELLGLRLLQGRSGSGLVFSATGKRPFDPPTLAARAKRHWAELGLRPICLHECRHTFAALAIDAGINPKALSTYMGHASITITLDRYGHLFAGNEARSARLLDRYLEATARDGQAE